MLFYMAEKLMLDTGIYPCQWTYREQEIDGQIWLEGSQAPGGEMFDPPGTWGEGGGHQSFSPHSNTAEMLWGRLRQGYKTVLLDVGIGHSQPGRSGLQARKALIGTDLPGNLLFDSVRFQVGGLTELSGVYPLKDISFPDGGDVVAGQRHLGSRGGCPRVGHRRRRQASAGVRCRCRQPLLVRLFIDYCASDHSIGQSATGR
jgi:hypothetical protein